MTRASDAKMVSAEAIVPHLFDGMTIGIGGFGLDRKPMTLLQAIATSGVKDLTIETYAGALDVELLIASGAVTKVVSCHVGLDLLGLAPLFRQARQSGAIVYEEWSEWSQLVAWRAAAEKVPFTTVRMDASSDLLRVNPKLAVTTCPFTSEDIVAVGAPKIDLAVLHAEAVHPDGSAIARGDPYLDDLLARAAGTVFLSAERLMDDAELEERYRDVHLIGNLIDKIVLAPQAALPGSCIPDYLIDWPSMRRYAEAPSETLPAVLAEICPQQASTS